MQTLNGSNVKSKPSGWMMMNGRMHKRELDKVAAPTRWELMLSREGLTEFDVLRDPRLVEKWVRKYVGNSFIPEKVLELLKIQ